jgi:hypothetical protein
MRSVLFPTILLVAGLGLISVQAQAAPRQSGAFCLQPESGDLQCRFASLQACNKEKTGNSDVCIRNPRSTTGSGMRR